jgi:hypothetical protein
MIGIYCRAGRSAGVLTVRSSVTLLAAEAGGPESGFSRCMRVGFGRLRFSIAVFVAGDGSGSLTRRGGPAGGNSRCLGVSLYLFPRAGSSDDGIRVVVTSIRSEPVLVTDCPRGSSGLPVWPVTGDVSDTIYSRFLWCLPLRLSKASRSGISAIRFTSGITLRLLGPAAIILLGPPGCEVSFCFTLHAPDAGGLA